MNILQWISDNGLTLLKVIGIGAAVLIGGCLVFALVRSILRIK